MKNKKAFTLAEVLITLGIIGVVAALTLPTLIQNHKKKSVVSKLQKASTILMQSHLMNKVTYGDKYAEPFEAGNPDIAYDLFNKYYTPNLKIAKVEKGTRGVFGYLDDGTALYFFRNVTQNIDSGWENTYIIFCLTHKACTQLDETSYQTIISGLGVERFTLYTDGNIPNSSINRSGRDEMVRMCKERTSSIESCSALIGGDGWVISDDYPHKL